MERNKRLMHVLLTSILFIFLICSNTFAGVVIITERKNLDTPNPETEINSMYIKGNKVKVETKEIKGINSNIMIYRGDLNLVWNIDKSQKSYVEINKKTLDAMAEQMQQAMKKMEQAFAKMPPEQRKMMEQMMQGRTVHKQPKKIVTKVQNTGKKDKFKGYRCTWHNVLSAGQKTSEMCVSSFKDIGIKKETFNVFKDMANFFSGLTKTMQSSPLSKSKDNPFANFEKLNGFPVVSKDYNGAVLTGETTLKFIEQKKLNISIFEVPPGYKKRSFEGMHMER